MFFSLVMKTLRIYSQNSFQIPSRGISCGHHVVHYIPGTYLSYNCKCVTFDAHHPVPPVPYPLPLLLLLLLRRVSRVRPCATPEMAAHQAPRSPGVSRQEHWSGLPFPSPMHESGK